MIVSVRRETPFCAFCLDWRQGHRLLVTTPRAPRKLTDATQHYEELGFRQAKSIFGFFQQAQQAPSGAVLHHQHLLFAAFLHLDLKWKLSPIRGGWTYFPDNIKPVTECAGVPHNSHCVTPEGSINPLHMIRVFLHFRPMRKCRAHSFGCFLRWKIISTGGRLLTHSLCAASYTQPFHFQKLVLPAWRK